MANPLPLKDLTFIEFGLTYLMLAPSRLQVDVLGKRLDVAENKIDAARITAALTSVGFHHAPQIYTQFQTYFKYLTRDSNRATLQTFANFLRLSGQYGDDPPHPHDADGQSLASALEALAGHAAPPKRRKARKVQRKPAKERG
jgi:hypothetical protein